MVRNQSHQTDDNSRDALKLNFLRTQIDNIDSAILSILAHRAQVVNIIIEYKSIHQIAANQSQLRQEAIDALLEFSAELQLRKIFVNQLLTYLFQKSSSFLNPTQHTELHPFFSQRENMLSELNRTLKHMDMSFCCLLSERMQLVRQVGEFKKSHHMQPLAKTRWEQVLQTKMSMAKALNINPDAIREFYNLIHEEALRIELECISPPHLL